MKHEEIVVGVVAIGAEEWLGEKKSGAGGQIAIPHGHALLGLSVALDAQEIEDGGRDVDVRGEPGDVLGVIERAGRIDHQGDVESGFVDGAAAEIGIFVNVSAAVVAKDDNDGVIELVILSESVE